MALTLEQYANYLDTRDLPWPAPPVAELPSAKPYLVRLPNVRAVTWSIYGTLLAISGGELYLEHPQRFIMKVGLDKTIQEFKMWGAMTRKPGQPADYLRKIYADLLAKERSVPSPGEKHPEIAVERVWEALVKRLLQKDYQFDAGFYGALKEFSQKIAYFFHSSLQATACYPGAAATLKNLAAKGLLQGLLADAQCFTIVQLQRGLRCQDPTADLDALTDVNLRALSHEVRARKPSERLFRPLLAALGTRGILPDQVLHVGSSVAQDVIPARRLGMRTALFAGDKASLQATPAQLKDLPSRPDLLVTELEQLAATIG
jgi:putative hydrolase of the HAD superfamily